MKPTTSDRDRILKAIADLTGLRHDALALEKRHAPDLQQVSAAYRRSARNLVHYLAVRRQDIRSLQLELQRLGLSSLGRMEASVLPTLNAVLVALHRMAGLSPPDDLEAAPDMHSGERLLRNHTLRMLGARPKHRAVRIMVTMPSEAAQQPDLIGRLLERGMDIMRVNCAHDDEVIWAQMLANRDAEAERLGRTCRVAFDLAGPKLRTGSIAPGPEVLKVRPERDQMGRVTVRARVFLTASLSKLEDGTARVPINRAFLEACRIEDEVRLTDARGRERSLEVLEITTDGCVCATDRTAYLTSHMAVGLYREGNRLTEGQIGALPARPQALELSLKDRLIVTREPIPGENARGEIGAAQPAHIACTLPEVFSDAKANQRILFDDGKIAGVIRAVSAQQLEVEITSAHGGTAKLRAEKGINLPDTEFHLSALTEKDLADLPFIAERADMVSLSFVRHRHDVERLIAELDRFEAPQLGIVLKIENRQAFENLPDLLLTALRHPPVAVMVARGDLGVEIGFERLAEVQEEILWLCEAAHIPVIWATQVLESLAKSGLPTRAEVTDAAMSGRAECVMLNKGPYIDEAVSFLDDVLGRMRSHQNKKTAMLRRLSVSDTRPKSAPANRPKRPRAAKHKL